MFFSQAHQDTFVHMLLYKMLGKTDPGYYLEIGAGEPCSINNTYFLEKECQWTGVSIDIEEQFVPLWQQMRANPLLIQDATTADYATILQPFPLVIDYLSLDIDFSYDIVLNRLPLDRYRFKIITIEHDAYKHGSLFREKERSILSSFGYHLLCSDVAHAGNAFEDWWIHPDLFPADFLEQFSSLDLQQKEHTELMKILGSPGD
jgi:hypothetical protein